MLSDHFIQANGLRLHYYRRPSDKPTLLLLHGLTDNGLCWAPVIEALGDAFDIVAPDARGHGLSDAPEQGYSAGDHAADVAALIGALELERPILIGHSMGGMVATLVAAQHPHLVRAAIFEDPAWFDAAQQPPETRRQRAAEWRADLLASQLLAHDALIAKGRANNPNWSDAELRPWAVAKQQARPQVLEYIEHEAPDWRAAVRNLRVPSLLIIGDVRRGVIVSPEQAHQAQMLNARLSVAQVADAGHSIRRDQFSSYMAAVRDFLAGIAP
ncbi:MAG: alpha/beta hydrolase [Thermoflexales bacterium]|nr:alpha/beta hydrolase [Thermoflexales bacterium]MDW8351924.1 alpha/beta fold hydrolase [Anaerolineae bacterium]